MWSFFSPVYLTGSLGHLASGLAGAFERVFGDSYFLPPVGFAATCFLVIFLWEQVWWRGCWGCVCVGSLGRVIALFHEVLSVDCKMAHRHPVVRGRGAFDFQE